MKYADFRKRWYWDWFIWGLISGAILILCMTKFA